MNKERIEEIILLHLSPETDFEKRKIKKIAAQIEQEIVAEFGEEEDE